MSSLGLVREKSMKSALLWTNILGEPLFTLYAFIPFILYKHMGATALQIALLTMLKPVVTTLSFYWSSSVRDSSHKLRLNVVWAGILMRLPFLFCPWFPSVEYMIFAAANYMFFYRAASPCWLEMLRLNISAKERSKLFSLSSAIAYLEGVFISLGVGLVLDRDPAVCYGLFFIAAVLGLITVIAQNEVHLEPFENHPKQESFKQKILKPWVESWKILQEQKDFFHFQKGFMICGFGIMLIQPALPIFAVDFLGVSYFEILSAISIAKGLGYVFSSPFWARFLDRFNIFTVSTLIFAVMGVFPFVLLLAVFNSFWLFLAYFLYGIGQGGSHLVWNLSGPYFSKGENSLSFTSVGVVLAGLRGSIAPPLGSLLVSSYSTIFVFILGSMFCFGSCFIFSPVKKFLRKTSS